MGQLFSYDPHEWLVAIHEHMFHGFLALAILFLIDHLRSSYAHFKPFSAHHFDENCHLEFPPALDNEAFLTAGIFHANSHVAQGLFHEPFPDFAGLNNFTFLAHQGTVVDGKGHGDRGLVHADAL